MTGAEELLRRWREDLEAWAIPAPILRAADRSPWTPSREVFVRRAERQTATPTGPSFERAVEALSPRGTVLDVGAGAGAACLPLAPWASAITAVDVNAEMVDALGALAGDRGVPVRAVEGRWPEVAAEAGVADVVVCHQVVYNVPDLEPFVRALTDHARRRVVVELTARHPLTVLSPLWRRLHGLDRPERPTADDAVAVVRALGLQAQVRYWQRAVQPEYDSFDDMVEATRRRLCVPADRRAEVARALRELGVDPENRCYLGPPGRDLVTLWWPGSA